MTSRVGSLNRMKLLVGYEPAHPKRRELRQCGRTAQIVEYAVQLSVPLLENLPNLEIALMLGFSRIGADALDGASARSQ